MKKINVAELLKNCPRGMELDCVMFNNATLWEVEEGAQFPISIRVGIDDMYILTEYGEWGDGDINAKCVIFPKGKDTWEGFVPPCKFKEGDIITSKYESGLISMILNKFVNFTQIHYHCALYNNEKGFITDNYIIGEPRYFYHATEEEKEKLFKEIEKNGYRWNFQARRLEKLIEPKFKVGDKVKGKIAPLNYIITITGFDEEYYTYVTQNGQCSSFHIKGQNNYELVPDKFDINTLVPFDKVLVRSVDSEKWKCDFFSNYEETYLCKFKCVGCNYQYCIPYKGNEHLLGTTNDCDKYYKTWED